jgi:hypothetical protein
LIGIEEIPAQISYARTASPALGAHSRSFPQMKFVTSFPEKNYGEKLALAAAVRYRYSLLGKNHRNGEKHERRYLC